MYRKPLFFSLLFVLASCGEKKVESLAKVLNIKAGEEFTIALDSNPTTGYRWTICNYTPASPIKLKDYRFVQAEEEKGKVGAPGKEEFIFDVADIKHQARIYLSINPSLQFRLRRSHSRLRLR